MLTRHTHAQSYSPLLSPRAEDVDSLDFSGRGWEYIPEDVFTGKRAINVLNRLVVLSLANNRLTTLPQLQVAAWADAATKRKGVLGRVYSSDPTAHKGDLLQHCPHLRVRNRVHTHTHAYSLTRTHSRTHSCTHTHAQAHTRSVYLTRLFI